jgi:hypothetical protein
MSQISPSVWLRSDGWVVGNRFANRRSGDQEIRRSRGQETASESSTNVDACREFTVQYCWEVMGGLLETYLDAGGQEVRKSGGQETGGQKVKR